MAKKVIIRASELHRAAGKALKRVAVNDEHLVVERDGYPVAVMLPYPEYQRLMRESSRLPKRNRPPLSEEPSTETP